MPPRLNAAAEPDEEDGGVAVAEPPAESEARPQTKPADPRTDRDTKRKRPPQYAVIVENDDDHTFPYVIDALRKVCGHPLPKATWLALQIHRRGRASVWTGSLEVAELKREQIRGYGVDFYAPKPVEYPLGVRIEKLP